MKHRGRGDLRHHFSLLLHLSPPFFTLAFFLIGCTSLSTERPGGTIEAENSASIEGVPFFPQEKHQCGPASLAAVLSYYGLTIDRQDIADEAYLPDLKGTLPIDMLLYAKGRGFNATYYNGGMDDLKEQLALGRPVILFFNLGYALAPRGHYVVAIGYDDAAGHVIAHSGRKREQPFSYRRLERVWGRTDFATLLILPRSVSPGVQGEG
ncbi:MAG: C39 family peptidase [Thermodesulfobacteriota bacterium]